MKRSSRLSASILWGLGGFLLAAGVVLLPSIGLYLLVVAVVVLTAAYLFTRGTGIGALFLAGALPFAWVAWLHRAGPGLQCWQDGNMSGCSELLNPWPWAMIALLLLIVGIVISLRHRAGTGRRDRHFAAAS